MRLVLIIFSLVLVASAQETRSRTTDNVSRTEQDTSRQELDRSIAARFAPVFMQGLGETPRADYITNFDFDGDWKGDNNWNNLDNRSFPLRAWVYYSVVETSTHYFVHYAVFHPRDYKGGLAASTALGALIKGGLERLGKDPTSGLARSLSLSHENDLEGCLVVAAKRGSGVDSAVVEYVETVSHNRFLKYRTAEGRSDVGESIETRGQQPVLFIEPKGHGISRFIDEAEQSRKSVNGIITYVYAARADDPASVEGTAEGVDIGYDLTPISETLWKHALSGANETYGEAGEYRAFRLRSAESKTVAVGSAFRGQVGFAQNMARPPWGWFDESETDRPPGEWFFDPAAVVARHFGLDKDFSTVYTYQPYLKTAP
jgi:hypothetical protein